MAKLFTHNILLCFLTLIPFHDGLFFQNSSNILLEDFENIKKQAYAPDNVNGKIGEWFFDDALIGSSTSDEKDGRKCVRIRDVGKISMRFDLPCPTTLTLQSATYGNDASSIWAIYISYDSGVHYLKLGHSVSTKMGELTSNKFYISERGKFRIEIRKEPNGKNRINIDNIAFISNNNTVNSTVKPYDIAAGRYKSSPKIQPSLSGDNGNMLLGNPDNAKPDPLVYDHYLIDEKYYVVSYSKEKSGPNWVSWHLSSTDLGTADRQNDFRSDSNLPSVWNAIQPQDYKYSGFDKGHNCPSGDRTESVSANSTTFLMSNIIPQAPNNNQHVWEHLESYCRVQVKRNREAYIICGSYGKGGVGKNGYKESLDNGKLCVPANLWKIVIIIPEGTNDLTRINADTRIIAVDIPNKNDVTNNWMHYLCTVNDIEKKTGYKFLANLPKNIANALKVKVFKGGD